MQQLDAVVLDEEEEFALDALLACCCFGHCQQLLFVVVLAHMILCACMQCHICLC